jgi:hypothetical protein
MQSSTGAPGAGGSVGAVVPGVGTRGLHPPHPRRRVQTMPYPVASTCTVQHSSGQKQQKQQRQSHDKSPNLLESLPLLRDFITNLPSDLDSALHRWDYHIVDTTTADISSFSSDSSSKRQQQQDDRNSAAAAAAPALTCASMSLSAAALATKVRALLFNVRCEVLLGIAAVVQAQMSLKVLVGQDPGISSVEPSTLACGIATGKYLFILFFYFACYISQIHFVAFDPSFYLGILKMVLGC